MLPIVETRRERAATVDEDPATALATLREAVRAMFASMTFEHTDECADSNTPCDCYLAKVEALRDLV